MFPFSEAKRIGNLFFVCHYWNFHMGHLREAVSQDLKSLVCWSLERAYEWGDGFKSPPPPPVRTITAKPGTSHTEPSLTLFPEDEGDWGQRSCPLLCAPSRKGRNSQSISAVTISALLFPLDVTNKKKGHSMGSVCGFFPFYTHTHRC